MDYNTFDQKIVEVMAEAINYCHHFDLTLNIVPSNEYALKYDDEIINNQITLELNLDYIKEVLFIYEDDNSIIKAIYFAIFGAVAEILGKLFTKCKKITRMIENEKERGNFAHSFCSKESHVHGSKLRSEMELTNTIYKTYKLDVKNFPTA